MNVQDVIEAGDFSLWEDIQNVFTVFPFGGFFSYMLFFFFVIVFLVISLLFGAIILMPCYYLFNVVREKMNKEVFDLDDHFGFWIMGFLATGLAGFLLLLPTGDYEGTPHKEWKNQYVLPYLESLPNLKKDVQSLQVPKDIGGASTFLEKTNTAPLFVSLVYTNDEGIAKKLETHALVHYTLAEGETPYFEAKYLKNDLGNRVDKGYYNVHVYLPKNYTLNYQ